MGVRGSGEWLGVEMGDPVGEKVHELLDKISMSAKIGAQMCKQRQNYKNVPLSKDTDSCRTHLYLSLISLFVLLIENQVCSVVIN